MDGIAKLAQVKVVKIGSYVPTICRGNLYTIHLNFLLLICQIWLYNPIVDFDSLLT